MWAHEKSSDNAVCALQWLLGKTHALPKARTFVIKDLNLSNDFLERSEVPVNGTGLDPLNTHLKGKTWDGGPMLTSPWGWGCRWVGGNLGN